MHIKVFKNREHNSTLFNIYIYKQHLLMQVITLRIIFLKRQNWERELSQHISSYKLTIIWRKTPILSPILNVFSCTLHHFLILILSLDKGSTQLCLIIGLISRLMKLTALNLHGILTLILFSHYCVESGPNCSDLALIFSFHIVLFSLASVVGV